MVFRREQCLLGVVGDQVPGGLAGVHVEPGDAPRMIVVEHQPGALLVRVVEVWQPSSLAVQTFMSGTLPTLTPCGQGVGSTTP